MSVDRSTRQIPSSWLQAPTHRETDFSSYSSSELFDCFQSETWYDDSKWCDENAVQEEAARTGREADTIRNEHVHSQKAQFCQEVENRLASTQNRPSAEVNTMFAHQNNLGAYHDLRHEITVNEVHFDGNPYSVLGTLIHEGTHANQVTGNGYDRHTLTMMDLECARDSNGAMYNYPPPSLDWKSYRTTCCELDSNNKAVSFVINLQDRYGNDPAYRAYISKQQDQFAKVDTILADVKSRQEAQLQQVRNSLDHGHISPQEAATLNDNIHRATDAENPYIDSAVQQHHQISDKLTEMVQQYRDEQVASTETANATTVTPNTANGSSTFSNENEGATFADDVSAPNSALETDQSSHPTFAEDMDASNSAIYSSETEGVQTSFTADFSESTTEQNSASVSSPSSFGEDVASEHSSGQNTESASASAESSFAADISASSAGDSSSVGSFSSEGSSAGEVSSASSGISQGQAH